MTEFLSQETLDNFEIIKNAQNLGAMLRRLSFLLDALRKGKNTARLFGQFDVKKMALTKDSIQQIKDSLAWLQERRNILKKAMWIEHPIVQREMTQLEDILSNKILSLNSNQPLLALSQLTVLIAKLSSFGWDPIFEGWIEIEYQTHIQIDGDLARHVKARHPHCMRATQKEIVQLSEKYRTGFVGFEHTGSSWDGTSKNLLCIGVLKEITLPVYIQALQKKYTLEHQKQWEELRDSDLFTLYQYLDILSCYDRLETGNFFEHDVSHRSREEIDNLQVNYQLRTYFSMLTEQSYRLMDNKKFISLINNLLNMTKTHLSLMGELKGAEKKSYWHKKAKEFAERTIYSHVIHLEESEREYFEYEDALQFVREKAIEFGELEELHDALTNTLVVRMVAPAVNKRLWSAGIVWHRVHYWPKGDPLEVSSNFS